MTTRACATDPYIGRVTRTRRAFDSLSSAAAFAAGTSSENGWLFWLAERNGERISLSDVRAQYLSAGASGNGTDRHQTRYRFWTGLLDVARKRTQLHAGVSPSTDSWIAAGAGFAGVHYWYRIRQHDSGVYLDPKGPSAENNREIFDSLKARREPIEDRLARTGDSKNGRKRCAIGVSLPGGYSDAETTWLATQERMADAMARLEAVFKPHLDAAVSSARR